MTKRGIALATLIMLWVGAASSQKTASSPTPATAIPAAQYRAVLDQYCVNCHNADDKVAGLSLDSLDLSNIGASSDTWEKVVLKL